MRLQSLPRRLQRMFALALALLGIPAALSVSAFLTDLPVRAGVPSPRTVVAPDLIRVADPEATDLARRTAADAVPPVLINDQAAKAAIVQRVRDAFAAAADAREPDDSGREAPAEDQHAALRERLTMLDELGLRLLVGLSDEELQQVAGDALAIAQQLARTDISAETIDTVAGDGLDSELAVRGLPSATAQWVVAPIVREALTPTVRVDEAATADARRQAADAVTEVTRSYPQGSVVVSAGDVPDAVDVSALAQRGLEGSEPWLEVARALVLTLVAALAVCAYLRSSRPAIWRSTSRMVLLASLFIGFTLVLEAVTLLAPSAATEWAYLVPSGAISMLTTILFNPSMGVLVVIPVTALVAFDAAGASGAVAFAGLASLLSVPLVSRVKSRGELRRAAWQSTVLYVVLAGTLAVVFDGEASLPLALLAGLGNGVLTAMLVNTGLPFLESLFEVVTATSLLDLADRNHPLLRELEQKALGSYNHSIMVSTLVERACRAIDADALLGSVAALYHDIGKVRRPWFFVENQFGIPNPHDELDPETSALVIQEHVTDGIAMGRSHRLPPEVVEGIATHHGTTLVSYFHRKALTEAGGDGRVEEQKFRYAGRKPASREMAVLMLADCCEAASRAAAQHDRNLSRADLELIVRSLVGERVDDGQLNESSLTFNDLRAVTASFIDTLVGVYHPRIAYPRPLAVETGAGAASAPGIPAAAGDAEKVER